MEVEAAACQKERSAASQLFPVDYENIILILDNSSNTGLFLFTWCLSKKKNIYYILLYFKQNIVIIIMKLTFTTDH